MIEIIVLLCHILINLIALKSLTVGSDYSFYHRFKYGKEYANWYKNRETFKDYLDRK